MACKYVVPSVVDPNPLALRGSNVNSSEIAHMFGSFLAIWAKGEELIVM
jgi:hypothetical protein